MTRNAPREMRNSAAASRDGRIIFSQKNILFYMKLDTQGLGHIVSAIVKSDASVSSLTWSQSAISWERVRPAIANSFLALICMDGILLRADARGRLLDGAESPSERYRSRTSFRRRRHADW